jgi:hypothetical protein
VTRGRWSAAVTFIASGGEEGGGGRYGACHADGEEGAGTPATQSMGRGSGHDARPTEAGQGWAAP